ncbi:MAG: DnaJ C-terminal domain-containing protein, partial [candidate division NC10 bacterium]|nr:DnaJ C-terminal domain-containing protein [candidate division NC10 bacterium]
DLYVQIEVFPHPLFVREGSDLICEVPISYTQAALGGEIEIPTLDGVHRLHVPPGTPSGKTFRLKGKGLPHLRGHGRGDQQVRLVIKVPTKLSARERELLEELAAIERDAHQGDPKGIFDRIKEKWG